MPCLVIGLTGGIGSGKSTVAQMLIKNSGSLIDADKISHAITLPGGRAVAAIAEIFGDEYITTEGALDRARMRQKVFDNPAARKQLEDIIHPLVEEEVSTTLASCGDPLAVVDIPLLVESTHWRTRFDMIVVVDCTESTQSNRVRARSGWTTTNTQAVIRMQAPRTQRLAAADVVIKNEHLTLVELSSSVNALVCSLGL